MYLVVQQTESFNEAYGALAKFVHSGAESSPRGMKCKEVSPAVFTIANPRDRLPRYVSRNFSIEYQVAEWVWYLSGSKSVDWISRYAPFWKNVSDDGITANSAYGARLFESHSSNGCDIIQWDHVLDLIKRDSDTRRAVLHIKTPKDNNPDSKDIPCTLDIQFLHRDGYLDCIVHMRSSDIVLGLAYDVPAFTLFQEIAAQKLGYKVGTYCHISNSLHAYERHYEMIQKIKNETSITSDIDANTNYARQMPELPAGGVLIKHLGWYMEEIWKHQSVSPRTLVNISNDAARHIDSYNADFVRVAAASRIKKNFVGAEEISVLRSEMHPCFGWYF